MSPSSRLLSTLNSSREELPEALWLLKRLFKTQGTTRQPDPIRPSLTSLGHGVIVMIIDHIRVTSPCTSSSIALINSYYNQLARYSQNKQLAIDLGKDSDSKIRRRLEYIERNGLLPAIRHVEVSYTWTNEESQTRAGGREPRATDLLPKLYELIPDMTGLVDFTWTVGAVPEKLLKLFPPEEIDRLQNNPNLTSLGIEVPLRELELLEYPFRPFGNEMDEEQAYWANDFEWPQLELLKTRYVSLALRIMPNLISIREVDFSTTLLKAGTKAEVEAEARTFFQQVLALLESIAVPSLTAIGMGGLRRHGPNLKKLEIHREGSFGLGWRLAAVDVERMRWIRDACPRLEELGINVSRDGAWPYDVFDVIASLPRLRSLTIWFELDLRSLSNIARPYVTFSEAGKIFKYLHERAARNGSRLQELEIVSGSRPSPSSGLSTSFKCLLSERDDEASKGRFSVECLQLSTEENERLRKLEEMDGMTSLADPVVAGPVSPAFEWARYGMEPLSVPDGNRLNIR
ncbi:hypothetical protein DL765_006195 [Monosporascus sp. GIB2]|nr:hypothetical protein DL765_006195 [Monosporascus sp. GIB2]